MDKALINLFLPYCELGINLSVQKYDKNPGLKFAYQKTMPYICIRKCDGAIAQLVEQRTENPCVPGSIPGGTTRIERVAVMRLSRFVFWDACKI